MIDTIRQYRGIVFDCDGVLFDSHPANLAYYNTVLSELGESPVLPEEKERAYLCHTACSRDVFNVLLGQERTTEALEIAQKLDYRRFIPYLKPYSGMLEVLPRLACRFPLALATNRTSSVEVLLEHFSIRDHFEVVVTSSDVDLPKPSPQMLHLAAEQLGVENTDLVFVGDAESDRQAARSSGMAFVAFGRIREEEMYINGWDEIAAWVDAC